MTRPVRSFMAGVASVGAGFASLGEGMAQMFTGPSHRMAAPTRHDPKADAQAIRGAFRRDHEALMGDWQAVEDDWAVAMSGVPHMRRSPVSGLQFPGGYSADPRGLTSRRHDAGRKIS